MVTASIRTLCEHARARMHVNPELPYDLAVPLLRIYAEKTGFGKTPTHRQTGLKSGKEYDKAIYCHPAI